MFFAMRLCVFCRVRQASPPSSLQRKHGQTSQNHKGIKVTDKQLGEGQDVCQSIPSPVLLSSHLCCSCLVVHKDDVEDRESAPSLPQQTPPIPLCVIMIIIIIKKACKALWSLHDGVFCTPPQPALHVVHFTAHRTCLWLAC